MSEAEKLQAEIKRLRRALDSIYNLAPVGSAISNLARQALVPECPVDCRQKHSVAEIARLEHVTKQAVYKRFPGVGVIRHNEWRKQSTS